MSRVLVALLILALSPTLFGLPPRTWTSADGKQIQATLMDAFGDEILIRRADGASFRLPLARVSKADRLYVQKALALRVTVPSALRAVVMINTPDGGSGTGFLTQRFGEVHLMTNAHVVRGADKITLSRADGRPLATTDTMEMARDGRDLVRFRMAAELGGLRRAESMRIGEAVYALGNSGGLNVLTPLPGQMIGIGAKEIEVTSPFIPGNSGGPILNRRNEVLGVATYVAASRGEWWAQGSRFTRVRRLATRIDGVDWVPLSLKNFQKADSTVKSATDKIEVIEKWKRIVRANVRSPQAKSAATQLIRASGRLESELRGLSAAARIPFLKEDVERVQGYNRKLKDELHALLKQVKD
ncbi:MAG: hypothetical protein CMI31_11165 [Opitutae bacterium]|nr:hypothetical protein [Opitutae bacterium]